MHKYLFAFGNPIDVNDPTGFNGNDMNISQPKWPANLIANAKAAAVIPLTDEQITNIIYGECHDLRSGVDDITLVYLDRAHVIMNGDKRFGKKRPITHPTTLNAQEQSELTNPKYKRMYDAMSEAVEQAMIEFSSGTDETNGSIYFQDIYSPSREKFYGGTIQIQRHIRGIGKEGSPNEHKYVEKWADTYAE